MSRQSSAGPFPQFSLNSAFRFTCIMHRRSIKSPFQCISRHVKQVKFRFHLQRCIKAQPAMKNRPLHADFEERWREQSVVKVSAVYAQVYRDFQSHGNVGDDDDIIKRFIQPLIHPSIGKFSAFFCSVRSSIIA